MVDATSAPASALYTGSVMHQRIRPVRHKLRYGVFSLLIDLDELPDLHTRLRLFSVNRFNLFSLHERDYGDGADAGAKTLRQRVENLLAANGLGNAGVIRLLTMPRILGYAFNPLSVYFCHDAVGELRAILYEVNNTFGERHSYLIEVDAQQNRRSGQIIQNCAKQMHVSPFLALDMRYSFRIEPPDDARNSLSIGVIASDAQGPMLNTRFDAIRQPLSDASLLKAFFTHPLLTLKVIAAIHWEAARLLVKGVRLHPKPEAPALPVTVIKPQDS